MTSLARVRRRSRREWLAAGLVLGGLFAFVLLVYVVVVLGGGALIGRTSSPDVALSVLATADVALAFDRVQTRLEKLASQAVHGGRASPYDVLRRFTETVTGSYPAEELPERMARVLADGTGAAWAQVWLVVGDRPTLAATWPPDATREPTPEEPSERDGDVPGRRSLAVRHGGELLGVLVVQEHDAGRRSPRSRNGCSPGSRPRRGWCCAVPGCGPSSSAGTPSSPPAPRSCGSPASAWSTPRTPSAGSWSATSTTAPSSTSSPWR